MTVDCIAAVSEESFSYLISVPCGSGCIAAVSEERVSLIVIKVALWQWIVLPPFRRILFPSPSV